jgi:serine/threonine-protein kinase
MSFLDSAKEEYASVYLQDTDKVLPEKIDVRTRYAYFKTIARGGKSLIQSCKDLHLCRVICYKSLHRELADDPIEQQRFLREARVTAMLQHPATVPVYELGREPGGSLYFTMKLVHGYTLRQILDFRDRYDLNQLMEVVVSVVHCLDYAHTHGVVHRDIKPENILVGPYGEVLLLDWGLAKVWNKDGTSNEPPAESGKSLRDGDRSMTGYGQLQGTLSYMSPEQVRRDPDIDHRTDIYNIGTVIYEILAGALPFDGDTGEETVDDILDGVLNKNPTAPSEIAKYHVPPLLEEFCLQCLKKNPADRIQSAEELVRDLAEDWLK